VSFHAANSVRSSHLFPCLVEQANNSFETRNGGGGLHPSFDGNAGSIRAAIARNFRGQCADENFALEPCLPFCIPTLFGHRFGAFHAPCGSSLFCFGLATLRVTVSLQIFFAKNAEEISPEPP